MGDLTENREIHYGPVWRRDGIGKLFSYAACEAEGPNILTTHKPWVTCEACKARKEFADAIA